MKETKGLRIFDTNAPYHYKAFGMLLLAAIVFIISVTVCAIALIIAPSTALYMQALSTILLFGGTAFWFWYIYRQMGEAKAILHQNFRIGWVFVVLLLLIISAPLVNSVSVEDTQSTKLLIGMMDGSYVGLVKIIICLAIVPGICEELFFRGFMQKFIISWTRSALAGIFITAAIFSFIHFDAQNFVARLLMGLVLGLLYQYSGRLWTSMLFHALNNTIACIPLWLFVRTNQMPETTDISWIWVVVSLCLLLVWVVFNELKNKRSIRNNSLDLKDSKINTRFRNFEEKDF